MPRTITAPALAILLAAEQWHWLRVDLEDPDGVLTNVSLLQGEDWLNYASVDDDIDKAVMGAVIKLRLDTDTTSFAPAMGGSSINRNSALEYKAFLRPFIEADVMVAVTAVGVTPLAGDWHSLGRFSVDEVDSASEESTEATLVLRDIGSRLLDRQSSEERVYGDPAGEPLADVFQDQILEGNLGTPPNVDYWEPDGTAGPFDAKHEVVFRAPSPPGALVFEWIVPADSSLGEAMRERAQQIGWELRYRHDPADDEFVLMLYEPDRGRPMLVDGPPFDPGDEPDWIVNSDQYTSLKKLEVKLEHIRNYVVIDYPNRDTGMREQVVAYDAASIAKYGFRWMKITEPDDSIIDSEAEAQELANIAISDLSEPFAEAELEMHLFWPVQLGDVFDIEANDVHFDSRQRFAVVGIGHELSAGHGTTRLLLRGKVTGSWQEWFRRGTPPEGAYLPELHDAGVSWDGADYYLWALNSPWALPQDANVEFQLREVGGDYVTVATMSQSDAYNTGHTIPAADIADYDSMRARLVHTSSEWRPGPWHTQDFDLPLPGGLFPGPPPVFSFGDYGDSGISEAEGDLRYLRLAGGTMAGTSLVTNMNADLLDGQHGSYYNNLANATGTLLDARLSSNVPLKNAANIFTLANTFQATTTNLGTAALANSVYLQLQSLAGNYRGIRFYSGSVNRWEIRVNNAAESGSDVGSDFEFYGFSDAGAALERAVAISRTAAGSVTLGRDSLLLGRPTAGAQAYIYLSSPAGTNRGLAIRSGTGLRWLMYVTSTAEAGGEAGSNFNLAAYDDSAVSIDSPLNIVRAAGGPISLARPTQITGTNTFSVGGGVSANVGIYNRGTINAVSTQAYGYYGINTLVATANSQTLAAIRLIPTFTPGAFTGLAHYGLLIGDITGGASSYALFTGLGLVRFGDAVTMTSTLNVSGASVFTLSTTHNSAVILGAHAPNAIRFPLSMGHFGSVSHHDSLTWTNNLAYAGSGDPTVAGSWTYMRAAGVNNIAGTLVWLRGNGTETSAGLYVYTAPTSTGVGGALASLNERFRVTGGLVSLMGGNLTVSAGSISTGVLLSVNNSMNIPTSVWPAAHLDPAYTSLIVSKTIGTGSQGVALLDAQDATDPEPLTLSYTTAGGFEWTDIGGTHSHNLNSLTGTLGVAKGGTGITAVSEGALLVGGAGGGSTALVEWLPDGEHQVWISGAVGVGYYPEYRTLTTADLAHLSPAYLGTIQTFTAAQTFNATVTIGGNLVFTGASRTITGLSGVTATTFTGALAGNATTATTLATTRTIWGQNFNGSANVAGAFTGATTGAFSSNVTVGGTLGVTFATSLSSTLAVGPTSALFVTADNLNTTYGGAAFLTNHTALATKQDNAKRAWLMDLGGRAADGTNLPTSWSDSFTIGRVAAGSSGAVGNIVTLLQLSAAGKVGIGGTANASYDLLLNGGSGYGRSARWYFDAGTFIDGAGEVFRAYANGGQLRIETGATAVQIHSVELLQLTGDQNAFIGGNAPVALGNSGGGYPMVGYNFKAAGSGIFNYRGSDTAQGIQFAAGLMRFYIAPAGTTGNPISFLERMRIADAYTLFQHSLGFAIGEISGVARVRYGSFSGTTYDFLTAANGYAKILGESINAEGQLRAKGWWSSGDTTGLAFEAGVSSAQVYIYSYNRGTSAFGVMNFGASQYNFQSDGNVVIAGDPGGSERLRVNGSIRAQNFVFA